MNATELQWAVVDAWKQAVPIDYDAALLVANGILALYPKEQKDFAKWFESNGKVVLQRINGA